MSSRLNPVIGELPVWRSRWWRMAALLLAAQVLTLLLLAAMLVNKQQHLLVELTLSRIEIQAADLAGTLRTGALSGLHVSEMEQLAGLVQRLLAAEPGLAEVEIVGFERAGASIVFAGRTASVGHRLSPAEWRAMAASEGFQHGMVGAQPTLTSTVRDGADEIVAGLRLYAAEAPLAGIHSLPFLGEALLKKLRVADERCILLTLQDQTIRETFYERGRLHFSRLSPLANTSIGGIAQGFATEAVKLQQYLLSQRLIARNQPLRAIVIAHPQAMAAVEASCLNTESLTFEFVGTDTCSSSVGLKTPPGDSHVEALLAHLAVSAAPAIQFAKETLRHDYRIWQIRNALYGFGAVILLGCTLFAAKEFYSTYSLNSEAESVAQRAQEARHRYEEIRSTFPPVPTNNETLRQIIDRYAELERGGGSSPETFYRELSAALGHSPNVDVDAIAWKSGGGAPATSGGATLPTGNQTAAVRGTISLGAKATPRQTLAAFDQFVADLRANPALEVKVSQQPFDIDSGKSLKSGAEISGDAGVRPYALEITRRSLP